MANTDTVRRRVGALGCFEFQSFLGTETVSMTNDIGPRPVTSKLQSRQEGEGFARVSPWMWQNDKHTTQQEGAIFSLA